MLGDHGLLLQPHNWAACCVQVGVLGVPGLHHRKGDVCLYAEGTLRQDHLQGSRCGLLQGLDCMCVARYMRTGPIMEYLLMQEASSGSIIPRAQKANQGNSGATSALMLEVPSGSALTVGQHGAKGRPGQCQRDVCLLRALLGKTNCRPAGNQGNNIMLCLPAGGSTCWAAGNACCDWGQNAVWLAALSRNAPCSKL